MIETDETKRDYHGRFSRFWWPGIVDEHTARRAAAYGAVMALFQAFLMLLVAPPMVSDIQRRDFKTLGELQIVLSLQFVDQLEGCS